MRLRRYKARYYYCNQIILLLFDVVQVVVEELKSETAVISYVHSN